MGRIEVWFKDGLFRAFPNVTMMHIRKDDNVLAIKFGGNEAEGKAQHQASINLDAVNFFEIMDEN